MEIRRRTATTLGWVVILVAMAVMPSSVIATVSGPTTDPRILLLTGFEAPVCGRLHAPRPGCEMGIQSDVQTGPFGGRTGAGAVRLQRQAADPGHVHVGDDLPIPGRHAFVGASFKIGTIPGAKRPYLQLAQLTPGDGTVFARIVELRLSIQGRMLGVGVFRTKQERYGSWSVPVDAWFTTILEMDFGRSVPLRLWVYDDRDVLVDTITLTADTTGGDRAQPRQTIGGTIPSTSPLLQYADDWWIATENLGPIQVKSADLHLSTAPVRNVRVGSETTATFRVVNGGPDGATGTLLSVLPATGATVTSLLPSQGACTDLACDLGSIAPGGEATVSVVLRGDVAGRVALRATVATSTPDPLRKDNEATAKADVR